MVIYNKRINSFSVQVASKGSFEESMLMLNVIFIIQIDYVTDIIMECLLESLIPSQVGELLATRKAV